MTDTTNKLSRSDEARRARRDDRGEGVISAAIAVLIVAFLGVAVWAGFSQAVDSSTEKVNANVDKIGTAP